MRAVLAGGAYFLAAFALGFMLGTLRALWIAPRLGEIGAVLLELPLMLGASWMLSACIARRLNIPSQKSARLVMGLVAFVLLIGAEFLLGIYGFGSSLNMQVAQWATLAGGLGLTGQMVFALIPLLQVSKRAA